MDRSEPPGHIEDPDHTPDADWEAYRWTRFDLAMTIGSCLAALALMCWVGR
ncbi:hypothetical protein [Frigidibacter oleivorans]|uniref:hypothetical protein n=1 Tax=Frigidibacter oleivorans TaxID=2487129 RepID=UPI0013E0E1C3|nr:hypothetical protein [Frigidibacter oleivorans]